MANKIVVYNGSTGSQGCSDPNNLEIGKEYEVLFSVDDGIQVSYALKGVVGLYNSAWFDHHAFSEKLYMAISEELPVVGESMHCFKLEFKNGLETIAWKTSMVKEFTYMGNDIYNVITRNSIYLVKICHG